jgi:hypothetical protein
VHYTVQPCSPDSTDYNGDSGINKNKNNKFNSIQWVFINVQASTAQVPIMKTAQEHKYNTKKHKYIKQTLNEQKEYHIAGTEI